MSNLLGSLIRKHSYPQKRYSQLHTEHQVENFFNTFYAINCTIHDKTPLSLSTMPCRYWASTTLFYIVFTCGACPAITTVLQIYCGSQETAAIDEINETRRNGHIQNLENFESDFLSNIGYKILFTFEKLIINGKTRHLE